jgi:hypothetical protein
MKHKNEHVAKIEILQKNNRKRNEAVQIFGSTAATNRKQDKRCRDCTQRKDHATWQVQLLKILTIHEN